MMDFLSRQLRVLIAGVVLALPAPALACDSDAFQSLKQLVGQWDVFQQDELAGRLEVRLAAGGCALIEEWRSLDGTRATGVHWSETITAEDGTPSTLLHQVYVDSTGWFIHADGKLSDGVIVYEGETDDDGDSLVLRATLHGIGSDRIVHVGDISTDDGATWRRSFTLNYQRTG